MQVLIIQGNIMWLAFFINWVKIDHPKKEFFQFVLAADSIHWSLYKKIPYVTKNQPARLEISLSLFARPGTERKASPTNPPPGQEDSVERGTPILLPRTRTREMRKPEPCSQLTLICRMENFHSGLPSLFRIRVGFFPASGMFMLIHSFLDSPYNV